MSKLLIDSKLLERLQERLDPHLDAVDWGLVCDTFRKGALPVREAVAWHTDDHLTDKSATTHDPEIAARWRAKGWPVTPLYAAPSPSREGE